MPRRAVPELARAPLPANVKDPGGKMAADYQFDVDMNAPEPVPPPAKHPGPQAAGGSSDDLPQAPDSVVPGADPAAETWQEPDAGGEQQ